VTGRYRPAKVDPRKPYNPDEPVTFEEVARLCGRSVYWVESHTNSLPVMVSWARGEQWVRRADVPAWIEASEREDVQFRAERKLERVPRRVPWAR
jgi:hypothetical protein